MSVSEPKPASPKSKRRWHQYSLRSLLVFVTLCALACSWLVIPTARARRFVAAANAGDRQKGRPPLSDFISEKQARLSTYSIAPITFGELWGGKRQVLIDIPADPEANGPSCTISYCVSRFDIALSTFSQRSGPGRPDWYINLMNQWESLLSKAGQHNNGLVLEARLVDKKAGTPPDLLLSVRNLGVQPVWTTQGACEQPPIVLIRDESGRSAFMTAKGEEFHAPNRLFAGSNGSVTVWPGDVREGESIPLDANFVLVKPGTYTLLAIKSVVGINGSVISKPVTFTIPPTTAPDGSNSSSAAVSNIGQSTKQDGREGEWSQLEANAGAPQNGYVWQADVSPVTPDAIHLVALADSRWSVRFRR